MTHPPLITADQPAADHTPSSGGRWFRNLLLWAVFIALFFLLFRRIPLSAVLAEFKQMTGRQILGLAALSLGFVAGVALLDGTAMWYGFLSFRMKMTWKDIVLARTARMVLDSVASLLGQAGLGIHIARRYQVPAGPAAGMVMFLFFLEIYGMIALSSLAFPLLFLHHSGRMLPPPFRFAILLLALAWPAFVLVILLGRRAGETPVLQRLHLASLLQPLQSLAPRQLALLLLCKTVLAAWQISLTAAAFRIFRLPLPHRELFALMPLAILVSSLPVTPARLGTTQWSWVFFFGHLAPEPALVAMSLLLQFSLNLARWLIGSAVLPFLVGDPNRVPDRGPNRN